MPDACIVSHQLRSTPLYHPFVDLGRLLLANADLGRCVYEFRSVAGYVDQYQGDRVKFEDITALLEFSRYRRGGS